LGLLNRLFGRSKSAGRDTHPRPVSELYGRTATAARGLAYDPRLIDNLQKDHRDLVNLFGLIGECAQRNDYTRVPQLLVDFKTGFEAHLIAENVRFYNYVENSLEGDQENYALIRSFRREMNQIARGVVDFVKKYQLTQFSTDVRKSFLDDYQAVGALLTQRIEREERNLYPLYQPG
jgi:hypothetical protein